jgi:hypothetical protein
MESGKCSIGLADPLGAAKVVTRLENELNDIGFTIQVASDLVEFNALKLKLRGERASPYHDPDICGLPPEREFWMSIADKSGKVVGIQAFRLDLVTTSLADWAPAYTIGLYMRRQELMIPMHAMPPRNSIAERISGRLAYHGELWIDTEFRRFRLSLWFGRIGLLLCLLKWQPDAIWALAAQSMAMNGGMLRLGYSHLERGFFRWQWVSEGIDPIEWIAIAERAALERLVNEILTTPQQSLLA